MLYLGLGLFAVGIIALDQLVKYWTVTQIALGDQVPVLDGVLHFTYVQNTGASFSMLAGSRWLFVGIFLAFTVLLGVLLWKKIIVKRFELWCLAAVWAGGVGNAIDRILNGFVVDMFEVEFISFAVFNVADIFIVCGCIGIFLYVLLFDHEVGKGVTA